MVGFYIRRALHFNGTCIPGYRKALVVLYKDHALTIARGWTALTSLDSRYRSLQMRYRTGRLANPCWN